MPLKIRGRQMLLTLFFKVTTNEKVMKLVGARFYVMLHIPLFTSP